MTCLPAGRIEPDRSSPFGRILWKPSFCKVRECYNKNSAGFVELKIGLAKEQGVVF
jgi:hypothetical protein